MQFNLDKVTKVESLELAVPEKKSLARIEIEYAFISQKIMGQIKAHLNHMNSAYYQKSTELGDLTFKKPALYLSQIDENGNFMGSQAITSDNSNLAYSFLMLREISGQKAYNLQPKFMFSFKKDQPIKYTINEVLDSFSYVKYGQTFDGHSTLQNGHKAINKESAAILKADKLELTEILKNTFSQFNYSCNVLKEATDYDIKETCKHFSDISNPDYFIEFFICAEIFNLVKDSALCQNTPHADL